MRYEREKNANKAVEVMSPRGGSPNLTADVGINIFIQSAGRPETRAAILDAKRINQTTTHYGLPVVQTQTRARKQV